MTSPTDPFARRDDAGAAPPPVDLPPVEAPSGAFIVQLFVIPAVVVLVVICVWLLFGKLAGGERDAMEYVQMIRASKTNWRAANRAAFELASLIQNDPKLAADPKLLGELTEVLEHDLDTLENPEMTQYVALALGRFHTLDAVTATGHKIDPIAVLVRALGPKSPEPVRIAAAASFAKHAARLDGKLDNAQAVEALASTSRSSQPELREMAVYALGFFGGEGASEALRESLNDGDRFARYNAAVVSAKVPGDPAAAGTIREMLRPEDLDKVVTLEAASEKSAKIEAIELEALLALQTAVGHGHAEFVRGLRAELTALGHSELAGVRNSAATVLRSLDAAVPSAAN